MNFFETDESSAVQALEDAQRLAYAPIAFQAARILRDSGILSAVENDMNGLTIDQVMEKVTLPEYGVRVLMEAALGLKLLVRNDGVYRITKLSHFILHDDVTRINMDFVHDVCYQGMFFLEESIKNQKPEGLKVFGAWPTIYEGLCNLPAQVQKSWFAFDHYYSDKSFPQVLPHIFSTKPKSLLDIGGNTGKWAIQCFEFDENVEVTIIDLPEQSSRARAAIESKGFGDRIHFHTCDILDESHPFPKGFDAIWMSQFLDCFSEDQIRSILKRCRESLAPDGHIYILELFWDRQRLKASAFALQQTSLYFTAMANGNSQMYDSDNFIQYIDEAGLEVIDRKDFLGVGNNTLLTCKPKKA